MRRFVEKTLVATVVALTVTSPALAGCIIPPSTPAPIVGLGIPALALFGLAYKRMRDRNRSE